MYLPFTSVPQLSKDLADTKPSPEAMLMLYVSDKHQEDIPGLVKSLDQQQICFFGGMFPGLVYGSDHKTEGVIATWLSPVLQPQLVPLSLDGPDWENVDTDTIPSVEPATAFVLVEFSSPAITQFVSELRQRFGEGIRFFGAGAGAQDLKKQPSIFCNDGVFENAAVVAVANDTATVKVRHGWQHHGGPFIVSQSDRNHIQGLNCLPALKTYLNAVPVGHSDLTHDNFYSKMAGYPLSIQKEGGEDIVRDPVGYTDDGAIIVLSDVPENKVMYIVHAKADWLIRAAEKVVGEVITEDSQGTVLVSDCFSRLLHLDKRFNEELAAAASNLEDSPLVKGMEGVLALGEIAADKSEAVEFYNKTFVACHLKSTTNSQAELTAN